MIVLKVAIYVRYSSDNQRQESIDAQIRAIKDYCDKNEHEIVRIYQDEAVSATSDNRDQFLQMIDDAKHGWFDAVIVHKLDRFARNRYDSAFYKRELRINNVRIISVLEQLDDSPEAVILESVLEGMAEYYSKNLAREVRKGLNENALKALHNGGVPPLGLNVNPDKTYSINETEAQAVRIIFDMYANGYGYMMIANELNAKNYKTKTGNPFGKNSIYEILRNEKYIGRYVFNRRASKKTGRAEKSADQVTRIDGALPQIVSDEVWNRVQDKMNQQKKPRMNATRVYLLTGHLECGMCGSNYVGASYVKGRNGEKYYIYACTTRDTRNGCRNKNIRADKLEQFVLDTIKHELLNEEAIDHLARMVADIVNEAIGINKDLVADLTKKRDLLRSQIDKLFDLYLDGNIDKNAITERTNRMKADVELYESRLRELSVSDFESLEISKIIKYMNDMRNQLEDADTTVKKMIIDMIIDKIIIYPDDVKIVFKIDPLNQSNKNSAKSASALTQGNAGGGEAYLTIPIVIKRVIIYKHEEKKRPMLGWGFVHQSFSKGRGEGLTTLLN